MKVKTGLCTLQNLSSVLIRSICKCKVSGTFHGLFNTLPWDKTVVIERTQHILNTSECSYNYIFTIEPIEVHFMFYSLSHLSFVRLNDYLDEAHAVDYSTNRKYNCNQKSLNRLMARLRTSLNLRSHVCHQCVCAEADLRQKFRLVPLQPLQSIQEEGGLSESQEAGYIGGRQGHHLTVLIQHLGKKRRQEHTAEWL